jgi:hypothetical protein
MERVFLKDRAGYKAGHLADWPLSTWKTFFPDYERITKPLAEALTDLVILDRSKDKRHGKT